MSQTEVPSYFRDSIEPRVLWILYQLCFSIEALIAYSENPHQSPPRIDRGLKSFSPEKNHQMRVWEFFEVQLGWYWLEALGFLEDIVSFVADESALAKRQRIFVALTNHLELNFPEIRT